MSLIQFIETARDEAEALVLLHGLKAQVDYRGGRILPPVNQIGKNEWRVQAFFDDSPDASWLPDGCRRVFIVPGHELRLGIGA